MARPVSPLVEEAETEEGEGKSTGGERTPQGPPAPQTTTVARAPSLLRKCYPSSTPQVPFLPSGHLEDCLPPCYHGTKAMAKLVKVSPKLVRIFFEISTKLIKSNLFSV